MDKKILTVTQVNKYVKQLFLHDFILNNIWISGEISNLKKHTSGHIYFTLKDKEASISAVMFKSNADLIKFALEDGLAIIVNGYISIYEKTGQYQLYIKHMEPSGKGALYIAYEQLKERLSKEGLFDESLKKRIPKFPKKIGIITSGTGAAIRDIVNVSQRRNATIQLILSPVLVQGIDAPKSISLAIEKMNEYDDIDLLIVGRGGGSIEDLWAFNEEIVARAIYGSKIPIISAVGHETDFTIADFVADLRAPTPSAAAEIAVPHLVEIGELLKNYQLRLNHALHHIMNHKRNSLNLVKNNPVFGLPKIKIDQNTQYLDQLWKNLNILIDNYLSHYRKKIDHSFDKLTLLNPDNNLKRGYSLLLNEENNTITSVHEVSTEDLLYIKLKDGLLKVMVKDKEYFNE